MRWNRHIIPLIFCLLAAVAPLCGCVKKDATTESITRLAREKEKQAKALNKAQSHRWPHEASRYFSAMEAGRWQEAATIYRDLDQKYNRPSSIATNAWDRLMVSTYALGSKIGLLPKDYWPNLRGPAWQAIDDANWAWRLSQMWDRDLVQLFCTDIINSIPPHSLYFGGSGAGRYLITGLCPSHVKGDPFFTLTQNALCDSSYLEYARQMYGAKIHLPDAQDGQKAFSDYIQEATVRLNAGKLKPGENISVSGGRIAVSGTVAVMEINAKILRQIFDQNPDHEFFIEGSIPLDWTYPYLAPHGLILKINHQPLTTLDQSIVDADRAFWNGLIEQLLGRKIEDPASLREIADYDEAILLKGDVSGFKGNVRFIGNQRARDTFARMRIAIAGVYAWRAQNAADDSERERMAREADLAFRQAFALCPHCDDLSRYADWLQTQNRNADLQTLKEARAKFSK